MTPLETSLARAMRAEGASDAAIAAAMVPPVTRQHVHSVLGPRRRTAIAVKPRSVTAPTISRSDFAVALRGWRARHSLTQVEAAQRLQVSSHCIAMWECEHAGCALAGAVLHLMRLLDRKENQ